MGLRAKVGSLEDGAAQLVALGLSEEAAAAKAKEIYLRDGDSGSYLLDIDGLAKHPKVAEFRNTNATLKTQLEAWEALGLTPAQAKEAVAAAKKAAASGDSEPAPDTLARLQEKWKKEHEGELSAKDAKIKTISATLDKVLVDERIERAARAAGVLDAQLPTVKRLTRDYFRRADEESEKVLVLDDDGDPLNKDPETWFKEVYAKDPANSIFFKPLNHQGAGAKSTDGQTPANGSTKLSRLDQEALNASLAQLASGEAVLAD